MRCSPSRCPVFPADRVIAVPENGYCGPQGAAVSRAAASVVVSRRMTCCIAWKAGVRKLDYPIWYMSTGSFLFSILSANSVAKLLVFLLHYLPSTYNRVIVLPEFSALSRFCLTGMHAYTCVKGTAAIAIFIFSYIHVSLFVLFKIK